MNRVYYGIILGCLWYAANPAFAEQSQALGWQTSLQKLMTQRENIDSIQLDQEPTPQMQEMFNAWSFLNLLRPLVWDHATVSVEKSQNGSCFLKKIIPYFSAQKNIQMYTEGWQLYPEGNPYHGVVDYEKMAQRLSVSQSVLEDLSSKLPVQSWIPLGAWHNLPWYHTAKKQELLALTHDYIKGLSQKRLISDKDMQTFLKQWILASGIERDFEFYLHPWPEVDIDDLILQPLSGEYDVNRIHMGIEYTTQYPFQDQSQFENKAWVGHGAHYDSESRSYVIGQLAKQLAKQFDSSQVTKAETSGHGHGLGIVYHVRVPGDRMWRVEWDGILRSYDPDGLIRGSERKGHIEVVTPKMIVRGQDLKKVFKTFAEMNSHPRRENGGGHVNVDLAPFEGRPDAMVRWLKIFHRWRGTLALLFQHPTRIPAAQPVELYKQERFLQKISNWNGSELSLKRTLYQHRYFNRRMNRKPRYVQMDLSYYFQDVIKGKFYKPDFDVKSPSEVWRAQFRLEPDVRKMELRMMDAPRHAFESALQIRVVRAMLDYALNQQKELSRQQSRMQKVDYVGALENIQYEMAELQQMALELKLPYDLLEWKMYDSLFTVSQETLQKLDYKKKLQRLYPQTENKIWGEAHKTNISRESLWQRLESQFIKSKKDKRANEKQRQRASIVQKESDSRGLIYHHSKVLFLKLGYVTPLHQLMQRWSGWPAAWDDLVVRSGIRLLSKFEGVFLARGLRGWFVEALNEIVQLKSQGLKTRSEVKALKALVESLGGGWIDREDSAYQDFQYACAHS